MKKIQLIDFTMFIIVFTFIYYFLGWRGIIGICIGMVLLFVHIILQEEKKIQKECKNYISKLEKPNS